MTTLSEAWKCCKCEETNVKERSADHYHCYCQFGRKHNHGICPHQERATAIPEEGVGSSDPKRSGSQ